MHENVHKTKYSWILQTAAHLWTFPISAYLIVQCIYCLIPWSCHTSHFRDMWKMIEHFYKSVSGDGSSCSKTIPVSSLSWRKRKRKWRSLQKLDRIREYMLQFQRIWRQILQSRCLDTHGIRTHNSWDQSIPPSCIFSNININNNTVCTCAI